MTSGVDELEFRAARAEDYEAVRLFLCDAGWRERVGDADRFALLMRNTSRAVVAFRGARVVGFARALCDEVFVRLVVDHDRGVAYKQQVLNEGPRDAISVV